MYVIRAAKIRAGFDDGSIHYPPPCTFSTSSSAANACQQEGPTPERGSVSAGHAGFAANLNAGWNNYSPSRSADDDATIRPASADPAVGGTGRSSPNYRGAPWRQGPTASAHPHQVPKKRMIWTDDYVKNCLISTFLASLAGDSPIDPSHTGQYTRYRRLIRAFFGHGTRHGELVKRARKDPDNRDFLTYWRKGTCPMSNRRRMWEPSGGEMPTVDKPQPFTVSDFCYSTRRNF